MSSLEARLSRLETSNRRWKLGAMLLLGCGLLGAGAAERFPVEKLKGDIYADTISCRAFGVIDANGKFVCSIVNSNGTGVFSIEGVQGKTTVAAGLEGVLIEKPNGTKSLIK